MCIDVGLFWLCAGCFTLIWILVCLFCMFCLLGIGLLVKLGFLFPAVLFAFMFVWFEFALVLIPLFKYCL